MPPKRTFGENSNKEKPDFDKFNLDKRFGLNGEAAVELNPPLAEVKTDRLAKIFDCANYNWTGYGPVL